LGRTWDALGTHGGAVGFWKAWEIRRTECIPCDPKAGQQGTLANRALIYFSVSCRFALHMSAFDPKRTSMSHIMWRVAAAQSGNLSIGGIVSHAIAGGAGGAILTAIVGAIKNRAAA